MSETMTTDIYLYLGLAGFWEGRVIASEFERNDDAEYMFLRKLEAIEVQVPTQEQITLAKIANLENENLNLQAETQKKIDDNKEKIKRLQALEYKQ